jgi:excinuclease ABC subunit B
MFELVSDYQPTGDQPAAIRQLVEGLRKGERAQTLLGVTGSGKTFTVANVITQINRPTLVLSHNKTLAAQLYGEFKQFFPNNAIEYFISYYDYYQPEAYLPTTGTYIEKALAINDEIEKLRLSATSSLLSGRSDVLVVASVSCIYGIGNPEEFGKNVLRLAVGDLINRQQFLYALVNILYSRTEGDFMRGNFRVKGDTVDIFVAYDDFAYRIYFFGDEVEAIHRINPSNNQKLAEEQAIAIFPANLFVTGQETLHTAMNEIRDDLVKQIQFFEQERKREEAERIKERTEFDLEMMQELGYCSGIENYSRYFDRRKPGTRPFCLFDYFPDDFLLVIDESHVTIPQIRGMYGGDRSRKTSLVEHGFRLPSALDNRPLNFEEFERLVNQVIFVSATPGDYELQASEGVIVEQLIRPTGVIDPEISVRPSVNQIDDLLEEVSRTLEDEGRVLITTLTKRMAEELSKYLTKLDIRCQYIHSDIKPLERVEILRELRLGIIDVLVGVNLLREGLDLPEVSLVAIMDADKEGFLRNERSLIQTIGRAARNEKGRVILYADKITDSMRRAMDETERRRKVQHEYNVLHNITPYTPKKSKEAIMGQTLVADRKASPKSYEMEGYSAALAADPVTSYMNKTELEQLVKNTQKAMERAAKDLDFIEAAHLRDELAKYKELLKNKA